MATSCDMLPEDVVYHILLWLPVVSLLRFKSVCKAWCSIIESSDFITQHLHLSKSRDNNKMIALTSKMLDFEGGPIFTLRFMLLSGNNFQMTESLDLPHRFDHRIEPRGMLVSCNGLICLVHRFYDHTIEDEVSLWNPATKQFRILPKSAVPIPVWDGGLVDFYYGFGFDNKTNDYKVVRIIHDDYILDGNQQSRVRVEVYSLNMDSWRVLDVVLPIDIHIASDPRTPYRDGIYCWSGWDSFMENGSVIYRNSILSFDFTKEVFGTMPMPDVYSFVRGSLVRCSLKLALLRENIACFEWVRDPPKTDNWHCKIWVLNEYGVKESWTKLYTVVLESRAFSKFISLNGMIIWLKWDRLTRNFSFRVCNPITQELMDLPFDQLDSNQDLLFANYKESCVSVHSAYCAASRVSAVVDV
ncbi:F-box family protein [Thalictrum thalictroides]|uniref:F-box family protein n=1 Tax=Thalictrum thalictroides TaxID=46969 RepID=A0A7J6VPH5_THATH|nr:F-box family protein [Thalictrum thalictroides]